MTAVSATAMVGTKLPTPYQDYIFTTRYARWRYDFSPQRRERWPETVDRYCEWMVDQALANGWSMGSVADEVREGILGSPFPQGGALPSMRALMTAGDALRRDNPAGYNCGYTVMDDPRAFDEILYVSMCGTGVGFSVERQYTDRLPEVAPRLFDTKDVIVVDDSRRGWAGAFRRLLAMLWAGHVPRWDMSEVRPAGAPLRKFGGRASGPAPLDRLFKYVVAVFKGAAGRKLTTREVHGIVCMIGTAAEAGGVRRSAFISLSNPSDDRMRDAKSGAWYEDPMRKHFKMANNSAVWTDRPDALRYFREITALIESRSGERGIINRKALQEQAARWGRRDPDAAYGVNPCSEIILRPNQFCNLSTIVTRPHDDLDDLKQKAKLATIMGDVQSTLIDFEYLRPIWRENCQEERLLGVSLGAQMDHPVLSEISDESARWMEELRDYERQVDAEIAERLHVNPSVAIGCQKPEGTTSQFCDTASGGHRRHGKFIIRRTRDSVHDPAAQAVVASGVPCEPDVTEPDVTTVMSWPQAAPAGAKTREDETALEALEMWLHVSEHYCEHKPSVTVTYRDDEAPEVFGFVYRHWDKISGIAFQPHIDSVYEQLPYETVTEEEYLALKAKMPEEIDWTPMIESEKEDRTTSAQEVACSSGSCEVDI
jgi:ribonucleoside-triphosphate reductase